MTRDQKYDLVNRCETLPDLAKAIRSFADENGCIQVRSNLFDAEKMAKSCEEYTLIYPRINNLTREFGIRQQAIYILTYQSF